MTSQRHIYFICILQLASQQKFDFLTFFILHINKEIGCCIGLLPHSHRKFIYHLYSPGLSDPGGGVKSAQHFRCHNSINTYLDKKFIYTA